MNNFFKTVNNNGNKQIYGGITMSFYDWLHKPKPTWKENLESCDKFLFEEIGMSRERLEWTWEVLDRYEVFKPKENS